MTPPPGHELEELLASIKKYCARKINILIGKTGESLWQAEPYDHIVRNLDELKFFRRYIAENPQKAGLREGEYTHFRAAWMRAWGV